MGWQSPVQYLRDELRTSAACRCGGSSRLSLGLGGHSPSCRWAWLVEQVYQAERAHEAVAES